MVTLSVCVDLSSELKSENSRRNSPTVSATIGNVTVITCSLATQSSEKNPTCTHVRAPPGRHTTHDPGTHGTDTHVRTKPLPRQALYYGHVQSLSPIHTDMGGRVLLSPRPRHQMHRTERTITVPESSSPG